MAHLTQTQHEENAMCNCRQQLVCSSNQMARGDSTADALNRWPWIGVEKLGESCRRLLSRSFLEYM